MAFKLNILYLIHNKNRKILHHNKIGYCKGLKS